MSKPSNRSPERKLQVVLSVLRGEVSATEATRRVGVAEQPVHNWKRASLDTRRDGLAQGHRRRSSRELELEAENEELRAALGEVRWLKKLLAEAERDKAMLTELAEGKW